MIEDIFKQTQLFFQENDYVVIKQFLDPATASLLYQYSINKVVRTDFLTSHAKEDYRPVWDGKFGDDQIPNDYNCYADPMMDTLLQASIAHMENYTGLKLSCNYSYWSFYQLGSELKRHRDRDS